MSSVRTSDKAFLSAVEKLRVAGMGTEQVAHLLVAVIGMVRPRRVLEVGMGYTTPFLAAALDEVDRQVRAESAALARKTRPYLAGGVALDETWLLTEPPLAAPGSYLQPYRPSLVAVDNLSIAGSSAGLALEVLRELDLDRLVTVVNADLRDCSPLLPADFTPIDLAWVDAWECLYFFDHFWERINPDGGLVMMHYLLNYPEGDAVLRYIAKVQQSHPGELEVVNLLESHKLAQNSVTILRRTSATTRHKHAAAGGEVAYTPALHEDAAAHLALTTRTEPDLAATRSAH